MEQVKEKNRPDYMAMARCLLPKIRKAAEDPEFMKAYQEWKKAREAAEE